VNEPKLNSVSLTPSIVIQIAIVVIVGLLIFRLLFPGPPVAERTVLPSLAGVAWLDDPPPEDLSGRIVLVDIWASWCGPCLAQMPDMVALHEKFADSGVVFIGLSPEPPTALPQIKAVVDGYPGMTWPIGYDAIETIEQLDWDHAVPTYILFDRTAKAVWSDHTHRGLEDELVRLLAE
jgi:thiol-disulfide isomerase/thioredoxin